MIAHLFYCDKRRRVRIDAARRGMLESAHRVGREDDMTRTRGPGRATAAAALCAALAVTGCQSMEGAVSPVDDAHATVLAAATAPVTATHAAGMGAAAGMMGADHAGMMRMHQQPVPAEYQGKTSPGTPDDAAIARGRMVYETYCALCHGAAGQGDGPSGATLDPPPAPVAMSSTRMGDDYLFWRISEGGAHFETGMPVWKSALSEAERWDVIHYMRTLGNAPAVSGTGSNAQMAMDRMHDAMLAEAQAKGVITPDDAALFRRVHPFVDRFNPNEGAMMAATGDAKKARQRELAARAVSEGLISQADADAFTRIHDSLIDAGIMP